MADFQLFLERQQNTWLFGHLGYDLKNELEGLHSEHPDLIGFPDIFFFEPEILIRLNEREFIIEAEDAGSIFRDIQSASQAKPVENSGEAPTFQSRISRERYLSIIEQLRQHILRGDCYEINFCQEFYVENIDIEPLEVYRKLESISPNPFSALYRLDDKWLLCASPERFLKKEGSHILSQPIKGTARRNREDQQVDEAQRTALYNSSKDRSENVMVVDLVRNDLARICLEGSVKVDELYGIYSFPQVHQMISTVSGELPAGIRFEDIIRACFPMGSMTGAPKRSVMQLIERYEMTKRGIFSGSLGYISPSGDFDFNVVIRSILFNKSARYISFPAGSGITFYSDPVQEWEECLLKATALRQALSVS